METILTLKLSERKLAILKRKAKEYGKTLEDYLLDLIDREEEEIDIKKDSIYNIKGRDSNAPTDLASEHDKYLYQIEQ
jgi:hypothetical protein